MFDPISSLVALPLSIGLHLHSIHLPQREWMNNSNTGIYALAGNLGTLAAYDPIGLDTTSHQNSKSLAQLLPSTLDISPAMILVGCVLTRTERHGTFGQSVGSCLLHQALQFLLVFRIFQPVSQSFHM